MRWAEWTAGGRVPDDVLEDLMRVLEHGLAPQPDPATREPPASQEPPQPPGGPDVSSGA